MIAPYRARGYMLEEAEVATLEEMTRAWSNGVRRRFGGCTARTG